MGRISNIDIKQALIDDLEGKKPFPAKWHFDCGLCGGDIEEGDDFFYLGNKKICNDCRTLATEVVDTNL